MRSYGICLPVSVLFHSASYLPGLFMVCKRQNVLLFQGWIIFHSKYGPHVIHSSVNRHFSSVQSLSRAQLFATPWTVAHQASLSNSQSLPKLMSIESGMPSNHVILCHPLLLPSVFPSIRVFSQESVLHIRWPKYWSFSFSITPLSEFIVTHWIPSNE